MNRITNILAISTAVISFAAMSCAQGPDAQQGTALGGLGGAAAGAIIGHQTGNAVGGAVVGGVLGATAGNAIGNSKDQKQGTSRY
jgi:hypothetical protein